MKNLGSADVDYIRGKLNSSIADYIFPAKSLFEVGQAYKRWKDLVSTNGPWDHKKIISARFGNWSYDSITDTSHSFETWSNIHYGYIGRASTIPRWDLLAGAGAAQLLDGHSPPGYWSRRFESLGDADVIAAFDESEDQEAIRIGMDLWEKFGDKVTVQDIIDAIRASSKLKTLLGVAC